MKRVMVDNWFMEDVVADIQNKKTNDSQHYADLLMAIVLWDEVYYPQNTHNWWNSFSSQVQNILYPINDNNEEKLKQSPVEAYRLIELGDGLGTESEIVGSGALHYMMLSNNYDCDYIPCKKRREFLLKYDSQNGFRSALKRMKMQEELDNTIIKYYEETYKALLDFSNLSLKMPVLAQFIIDNTPKEMTPVDFAFHLKNMGPIIQYRQYLSRLEDAFEEQNWGEWRYLMRCSKDAVSDVISMDRKSLGSIQVKLVPFPSLTLKLGGFEFGSSGLSLSFDLSSKKMHLSFLRDLTYYAINDMKH